MSVRNRCGDYIFLNDVTIAHMYVRRCGDFEMMGVGLHDVEGKHDIGHIRPRESWCT